ncbi:hypothetical protein [Kitasatospora cineracea]|uniref:Uncharacterized protein n=1 Tax=Kitasatospora cineracea TaxID=88074 RepID=A0A8G1UFE0_9ACTN|nr:hypothetical protein [Kitasatospora cineracea]ROR42986.1 hypothetical protein EDD39_1121 [Kitasatospora cineracea]
MTWFAVGDTTDDHPKILAAGNAAVGLWVRCGAYASAHLTDGLIPAALAAKNGTATQIAKLLAVGLWHEAGHHCGTCPQPGEGEYVMHGYLEANPSRSQVEERRRRAAAKKRRQRGDEPDSEPDPASEPEPADGEHPGQQGESPRDGRGPRARPAPALPSRREGAGVGGEGAGGWGAARRHPLPDNFAPDAAGLAWAAAEGHADRLGGPDGLAVVTAAFADWHRGRATLGANWQALWRKWVREQRECPGAARPAPARAERRGPGRRGASDAAGVSVAERFAAIEDEIAQDREPTPETRPLTLVPDRPGGRAPRAAAPMPGQHPLMAALPGGRARQPDPVDVLTVIADHGQASAVAQFGWRVVAALLAADGPQAGEG